MLTRRNFVAGAALLPSVITGSTVLAQSKPTTEGVYLKTFSGHYIKLTRIYISPVGAAPHKPHRGLWIEDNVGLALVNIEQVSGIYVYSRDIRFRRINSFSLVQDYYHQNTVFFGNQRLDPWQLQNDYGRNMMVITKWGFSRDRFETSFEGDFGTYHRLPTSLKNFSPKTWTDKNIDIPFVGFSIETTNGNKKRAYGVFSAERLFHFLQREFATNGLTLEQLDYVNERISSVMPHLY